MCYLKCAKCEFEENEKSEKLKNGSILPMVKGRLMKSENLRFWDFDKNKKYIRYRICL